MSPEQLEATVVQAQQAIAILQSEVSMLRDTDASLLRMQQKKSASDQELREKQWAHDQEMQDRDFLDSWKRRFQFLALKEMLFESADKLGLTTEQMEADFDRRWKKRLDENLQKLEETHPNLAGRVDERSEDEIPD